jgi:hypothetical protein
MGDTLSVTGTAAAATPQKVSHPIAARSFPGAGLDLLSD